MMKKAFLILAFFTLSHVSLAQMVKDPKTKEEQKHKANLGASSKTMVINITGLSYNTLRQFKKELNGWNGKVISSQIDTIQKRFTIVHNLLLHSSEMTDFLKKYQIKNSSIISYN